MTKRRLSSSDLLRQVAALACGLCLAGPVVATVPPAAPVIEGLASYYGSRFHGRRTASGERFDRNRLTAASNRFPLGAHLAVQRTDNGLCTVVRVNDRMHRAQQARVIDLSRAAAGALKMLRSGLVEVRLARVDPVPGVDGSRACVEAFLPIGTVDRRQPELPGDVGYNPQQADLLRPDQESVPE